MSNDNQPDVAAKAAPEQDALSSPSSAQWYESWRSSTFDTNYHPWPYANHYEVCMFATDYSESVAAPLRAEIARLTEEHEADRKFIRFYRSECARHGMTGRVDINGWPIQLTNERAATLEAENSTLRQRVATLATFEETAHRLGIQTDMSMVYHNDRAEAAEQRVAALTEALGKLIDYVDDRGCPCDGEDDDERSENHGDDCPITEACRALRDQEGHNG